MAKKTKKQELRFDAHITCGEVYKIASQICDERTNQMAQELVDKYIDINHADHIKNNKVVYNKLLNIARNKMKIRLDDSDYIYCNVINADYDIRHGWGNGRFI